MFKTNEEIIVIQAKATTPVHTGVVFWSHDKGTAKLLFQLKKGTVSQTLAKGTIVPICLVFIGGRHIYHAVIEDAVNGIVSIVLEDNILGYVGRVEGSIYIELPDSRSLDTAGRFTFDIKRSPIDENVPELEDYYWQGFSEIMEQYNESIAEIKSEAKELLDSLTADVTTAQNKVTTLEQSITTANTNLNTRINEINKKIDDNDVFTKAESSANVIDQVDQLEGKIDTKLANKADKTQVDQLEGKIDTKLANKADKTEVEKVEEMVSKMPSATPRETFNNLSELKVKYPTGDTSAMVVLEADGVTGYVYLWNGSEWKKGALYQAQGIADKSLQKRKLGVGVLKTEGSENLCKYENIYWGAYVAWSNGNIGSDDNYCHVVVPIDSSRKYLITGTNEQGCFKDINGNYISGYQRVTEFPEIPANAAYLWQTVKTDQIDNTYIGLDEGILVAPEVLDTSALKDGSIPMVKNEIVPFLPATFNAFEPTNVKSGVYIIYRNGQESFSDGYLTSQMIQIDPRTRWEIQGTTEQFALYDSFGRYVTGYPYANNLAENDLDPRIRFIRISMKDSQIKQVSLKPLQKIDNSWFSEENASVIFNLLEKETKNLVRTVKKDGSGDYDSLREAIETEGENVTIKIFDDFTLEEEYSESEIKNTSFKGYALSKNHTLEGIGNVTLYANLDPEKYSAADIQRVSTVTPLGDGTLKNLTIVGESVRYAFHPETHSNNLFCEDVTFIKKKSGTYCQAMAGGTRTGQTHRYKNCTFISEWTGETDVPASYHTNVNFTFPCTIKFEDCRFQSVNSAYELRLGGMASNQKNIVELIGNRLSNVLVREELMDGVGLDYIFRGRGNRKLTFIQQSKSGNESAEYDFVEDININ